MTQSRKLPISNECFVCGKENPLGLKLLFEAENGQVSVSFTPSNHYMGYENVLHGGVITAVLDEAMGWAAALAEGRMCMAAELTMRFRRPVIVGQPLTVRAQFVEKQRKILIAQAQLTDANGTVLSSASGKFLPISDEKAQDIDRNYLIYLDDGPKLFSD